MRSKSGSRSLSGSELERKAATVKIVHWKADKHWLGYLQDYPDYWTQGTSLEDLKDHLRNLYSDIQSGEIPGIRKVEELIVS